MGTLLGIDAGTTAIKATVYSKSGVPLASGNREYSLSTKPGGIVETNPESYWSSLKTVLRSLFSRLSDREREVTALAISSQGESFVVLDKNGAPLRDAIIWLDERSKKEALLIEQQFGAETVYHTTGSPEVTPTWASTKLLWLREHEYHLFKKISKILFVEDFLIYRLTGEFEANGALYCSSLLYDIHENTWWQDMLEFIGLKTDQLSCLYPSGVKVGVVKQKVAAELGFLGAPIVVSGGMDQACCCIGTGNISSGVVTENTGSSLNISVTLDHPIFDSKRRVPCQTHAIAGKFIYLPWCSTAGMTLRWFKDNFCEEQAFQAQLNGTNVYDILTDRLHEVSPGSGGLIVLPHLAGAMSPEMDNNARGVICGLSLSTTRDHIVRAILESVSYMSRANIELIEEAGIEVEEIILSGGAAESKMWNQIKADVLGKRVKTIKNKESGCLGAAILAGIGAGFYDSVEEACEVVIEDDVFYFPNRDNHLLYEEYYDIYAKLYMRLRPVFQLIAQTKNERD